MPRLPRPDSMILLRSQGLKKSKLASSSCNFPIPATPTDSLPGTEGKIEEMTRRLERGESLFHPSDQGHAPKDVADWLRDDLAEIIISHTTGIREQTTSAGHKNGRYRARPYLPETKGNINLGAFASKAEAAIAILEWQKSKALPRGVRTYQGRRGQQSGQKRFRAYPYNPDTKKHISLGYYPTVRQAEQAIQRWEAESARPSLDSAA
jgi:hypothetical protein